MSDELCFPRFQVFAFVAVPDLNLHLKATVRRCYYSDKCSLTISVQVECSRHVMSVRHLKLQVVNSNKNKQTTNGHKQETEHRQELT